MPFFAVLTAAAEICYDINAAAIEPESPSKIERGREADAVATVGVEQRWISAIEFCAFATHDIEGNFCAVFREGEFPNDFNVVERDGRSAAQRGRDGLLVSFAETIPDERRDIAHVSEKERSETSEGKSGPMEAKPDIGPFR